MKSDTDYAQTRSVYEQSAEVTPQETTPQETVPEQTMPSGDDEAACGCAASAEIGTECDCEMHGSCLCDATCRCNADICKEQVNEMS